MKQKREEVTSSMSYTPEPLTPEPVPVPTQPSSNNADIGELIRRIQELEARQPGLQFGPQGLVGTYEKYKTDPNFYPDPTERLRNEPQLQRFAFKDNYELSFSTNTTSYETRDGRNVKEPKFNLDLVRIIYDEDTGEKTNKRYTVCRMVFHEDPQAAVVIAREQGLPVNDSNEKSFLDEMRYLRMRDWLFEAFLPPKPQASSAKREMVIGNKLVEVFEVNSEDSKSIPFSELKSKL